MKSKKIIAFLFVLISIYSVQSLAAEQPRITFSVKALFKDRAMIEINGTQHLLSVGDESPEGITLLSSNVNEANIYCHGNEYTLYINQTAYSFVPANNNKTVPANNKTTKYKMPKKMVPGKTIPFVQTKVNGITKYMLKTEYDNPSVMEFGQDAIWIGAGKKLLRFDIKKEAGLEFDLSSHIRNLSVSDKAVILNASKMVKNKRRSGLFLLDTKNGEINQQLDAYPDDHEFIEKTLWFLDHEKGLGRFQPKINKPNINYKDALLYKEKKKEKTSNKDIDKTKKKKKNKKVENAYKLSTHNNDIWYSHRSKFKKKLKKQRLNETCVSHYNKKSKTFKKYSRKQMGLDAKYNCSHVAASKQQIWVSHERKDAGLSMFNTSTNRWKHILASANNMLIGGDTIMLDNNQLWMVINNQLIGLNTKTLHANVVLGDAVVMNYPWQSKFYVKNGYAWYITKESPNNKPTKSKTVLYKIPTNAAMTQLGSFEFN